MTMSELTFAFTAAATTASGAAGGAVICLSLVLLLDEGRNQGCNQHALRGAISMQ